MPNDLRAPIWPSHDYLHEKQRDEKHEHHNIEISFVISNHNIKILTGSAPQWMHLGLVSITTILF